MSDYVEKNWLPVLYINDENVDVDIYSLKDSNLKWIRILFSKVGTPPGNMTLKILDATKTTTVATSNTLKCNFSDEAAYVGTTDLSDISAIRFDFNGEAIRKNTIYYVRLECDSAYTTGKDSTNYLATVLDFPKPTNDNYSPTVETTHGNNISKYPQMVVQVFGRDYGESA